MMASVLALSGVGCVVGGLTAIAVLTAERGKPGLMFGLAIALVGVLLATAAVVVVSPVVALLLLIRCVQILAGQG
jgi:hypothetical protein